MEIWKDVQEYEGCYQISNLGRVRSLDRIDRIGRLKRGKVLAICNNGKGYQLVCLKKDGNRKNKYIHRLVGIHFLNNPSNKPEINHLDEDKLNNKVDNLEWATQKENMNHGTCIARTQAKVDHGAIGAKSRKKVIQYDKLGNEIKVWDGIVCAAKHIGCDPSLITMCIRGKRKSGYGFIWKEAVF